jgi:sec-independent protein translocase protein TatA
VPLNPPAELFGEQGIIVLIVIAVVLFGSTQIPKLARSLGSAQKEFKKGLDEGANGEAKPGTKAAAPLNEAPQATAAPAPAPAPPAADGAADASS